MDDVWGWGCGIVFLVVVLVGAVAMAVVALGDMYGEPLVAAGTTAAILSMSIVLGQVIWLRDQKAGNGERSPVLSYFRSVPASGLVILLLAALVWWIRRSQPDALWFFGVLLGGSVVLVAVRFVAELVWSKVISASGKERVIEHVVDMLKGLTVFGWFGIVAATWGVFLALGDAGKGGEGLITLALGLALAFATAMSVGGSSMPDRWWESTTRADAVRSFCLCAFLLWALIQLFWAVGPARRW